ncbi:MAG: dockerin type I repeat-containing protein [Clostridia bacterium]|nr:dockerin type I repeat-containing protein [Clostridia bacterium]
MRNMKKILAFVLVLMLALSTCVVGASAAEDQTIYFEVPADWTTWTSVFCHVYVYGGDSLANWQSKKEKCTATDTEGLFSYNLTKVGGIEEGVIYGVIFSVETGMETYTTLMSTDCIGDTLYCDDTIYENPVDSNKTCRAAFWKNQDATVYGPLLQITSIGNIVGTCLPPDTTVEDVFLTFLVDYLDSARTYSGKDDQTIIDDVVQGLGLTEETTDAILTKSGVSITWNGKNYVGGNTSTGDEIYVIVGDSNLDGKINIKDATYIQKALADIVAPNIFNDKASDTNGDGIVNIKDATTIQKSLADIEVDHQIGTYVGIFIGTGSGSITTG